MAKQTGGITSRDINILRNCDPKAVCCVFRWSKVSAEAIAESAKDTIVVALNDQQWQTFVDKCGKRDTEAFVAIVHVGQVVEALGS